MARTRKRMTPEQYAASIEEVATALSDLTPIMSKLAKRYQTSMRKNARSGRNADGSPMAPLSPLTMKGRVTTKDGSLGQFRSSYGSKPLKATGQMAKELKAVADSKGWVAYVNDESKRIISFWQGNVPSGEDLFIRSRRDKSGRAMARAMAKKGMPVRPETAARGFRRPARLPFGLSSRQVKRSIGDLNKFVLRPFLK